MSSVELAGERERSVSLGYVFYTQIAGVLGAFSLAAFAGHYFHLGWRGLLLTLVGCWDAYVRPTTNWLLDVSIVSLVRLVLHARIELPLWLKDYLSVGLILCLSWVRASRWAHAHFIQTMVAIVHHPEQAGDDEVIEAEETLVEGVPKVGYVRYAARLILNVVFWPLELVSFAAIPFVAKWRNRLDRIAIVQTALTLSPLVYFSLLYGLNVAVLGN